MECSGFPQKTTTLHKFGIDRERLDAFSNPWVETRRPSLKTTIGHTTIVYPLSSFRILTHIICLRGFYYKPLELQAPESPASSNSFVLKKVIEIHKKPEVAKICRTAQET